MEIFDFAIIGGGASGLFALQGLKEKKVVVLEGNEKLALKLLATGGGKCNFTNLNISSENFVSENPHFVKSFLARYGTYDFLDLVEKYQIPYEERDNGKLFTLSGAKSILEMLLQEGFSENHTFKTGCLVENVIKNTDEVNIAEGTGGKSDIFTVETNLGDFFAKNVLVASGGLSYPQMGATNIASKIAKSFGMKTVSMVPALAGLRYPTLWQGFFARLSGIAITAKGTAGKRTFTDQLLFTHRGFSGPLALNLSLFVKGETEITFDFMPEIDVATLIQKEKQSKKSLINILSEYLPKSLVKVLLEKVFGSEKIPDLPQMKKSEMEEIGKVFNQCKILISDLDGFDKAEVTGGGVSVDEIFPKTMESKKCPGLYFIGEALDVTGMLGGYNLHWAWASANMFISGLEK